jgi:riboflavin-specific deaminase-like protein
VWFANVALSFDAKISELGKQVNISSEEDWKIVHKLRNTSAGIAVGSNTILVDNPSLLVKSSYLEDEEIRDPVRIVFDRRGRCQGDKTVFKQQKRVTTLWVTQATREIPNITKIPYPNLTEAISIINDFLDSLDRTSPVMVEGGSKMITSLVKENILSSIRVYRAPFTIPHGVSLFEEEIDLELCKVRKLDRGCEEWYKFI